MKKAALISVSNRDGLKEFAQSLKDAGYTLLATSGSARFLSDNGIESLSIEEYTGQAEILDGRVKTLHPKIHAGLLARRDSKEHMQELASNEILQIDIAVVNLYPFIDGLATDNARDSKKMEELIDIGGPTMIRAAAKNYRSVIPVIDPADYPQVIHLLKEESKAAAASLAFRRKLATKVFTELANYNLEIAKYLSREAEAAEFMPVRINEPLSLDSFVSGLVLQREQELRYGENPAQKAGYYRVHSAGTNSWRQLHGKELSYNNLLDFDAAVSLVRSLPINRAAAVIVKHLNPCGVALSNVLTDSIVSAKRGDPRSHFGGIIALNQRVGREEAELLSADFTEIIVAPSFSEDGLEVLQKKKNLRLLEVNLEAGLHHEIRAVEGGFLLQEPDHSLSRVSEAKQATERKATDEEFRDLELAWSVCAHVKSNAIVLVKNESLIGIGAGQMSRIDSVELALNKARTHGHQLEGAVAASDAFFPFSDSLEILAAQGIRAIIAPSGAKKDEEVIAVANKAGITLLMTQDRHFKH